jgi:hypothetical protein
VEPHVQALVVAGHPAVWGYDDDDDDEVRSMHIYEMKASEILLL